MQNKKLTIFVPRWCSGTITKASARKACIRVYVLFRHFDFGNSHSSNKFTFVKLCFSLSQTMSWNNRPTLDRFDDDKFASPYASGGIDQAEGNFTGEPSHQLGPRQPGRPGHAPTDEKVMQRYNEYLTSHGISSVSAEDLAILQECGRESMVYRCKCFYDRVTPFDCMNP